MPGRAARQAGIYSPSTELLWPVKSGWAQGGRKCQTYLFEHEVDGRVAVHLGDGVLEVDFVQLDLFVLFHIGLHQVQGQLKLLAGEHGFDAVAEAGSAGFQFRANSVCVADRLELALEVQRVLLEQVARVNEIKQELAVALMRYAQNLPNQGVFGCHLLRGGPVEAERHLCARAGQHVEVGCSFLDLEKQCEDAFLLEIELLRQLRLIQAAEFPDDGLILENFVQLTFAPRLGVKLALITFAVSVRVVHL